MARDVFISHSAQDKAVADAICTALENAAISCWVAPRDVRPGRSFPGEITRAIQQSKVMVLVFSSHSNNSEQVLREVQLAVDSHLPIVRFRIEDVPLTDDLRYYLSTPHWLDALTRPVSKHIPRLELAVKELLEQAAEDDSAKVASTASAPPKESAAVIRGQAIAEKSTNRGKLLAVAAVLIALAVAAAAYWLRQSPTPLPPRNEPTAAPTVQPTHAPEPTASPTPKPSATPEPTAAASPTMTPASTIAPPQPNKAGPTARNNRPWKAWIDDFVHQYVRSNESSDVDLAMSFFAPKVDLFEEGIKPLEAIRRDTEAYNARWPSRRATIRGDVQLGEKASDRSYTARFEADYYVENPTRGEWINLAVLVDLQIAITDGLPQITSMKQKTLRKEKGTMQPRSAETTKLPSSTASPDTILASSPVPIAAGSPDTSSSAPEEGNSRLIRVVNTRYGFSVLIPQDVFINPQTSFATDRQMFSSADRQTVLTLFVQPKNSPRSLRDTYGQWAAQHTRTEPGKIVDYKVLRDNWFVVSGQNNGRGFYVKAVVKGDVLAFMHFECDENHYPVNKETLAAMSHSFDGK